MYCVDLADVPDPYKFNKIFTIHHVVAATKYFFPDILNQNKTELSFAKKVEKRFQILTDGLDH